MMKVPLKVRLDLHLLLRKINHLCQRIKMMISQTKTMFQKKKSLAPTQSVALLVDGMNDSTESSDEGRKTVMARKRKRLPDTQKRTVAKRMRNCGQEYISRSQKVVKEKSVGPVCNVERCRQEQVRRSNERLFSTTIGKLVIYKGNANLFCVVCKLLSPNTGINGKIVTDNQITLFI